MRIRHLLAFGACAALLGLAASALVRAHYGKGAPRSEVVLASAELAPVPEVAAEADGDAPDEAETPTSETSLTSSYPPGASKRRSRARPADRKAVRDAFLQELARGIRKLGEHRYEIERDTLEMALRNLGPLAKAARVRPEVREGKPLGFRLFAIRGDGPIAKLGLCNDDVLVSVNGLDIATPDRVLEAYGKLKSAGHLVLGLVRGGRELAHDYTIR